MTGKKRGRMTELEALQRPFYVDPGSNKPNKSGRRTRNSRVSKAAAKNRSAQLAVRKKWAAAIEKFSRPQPTYPRFLFRGIRPDSGGGEDMSPMLNTDEGVVPHAFTSGEDYDLWSTPNLRQIFNNHLRGSHTGDSPFSSWTPSPEVALGYSRSPDEGGSIAMLDTSLLSSTELPPDPESSSGEPRLVENQVFHAPDLFGIGMAANPDETTADYICEYLVYGPVAAPAFRSVPVRAIRAASGDLLEAFFREDESSPSRFPSRSSSTRAVSDDGPLREEEVAQARAIAELYRHRGTGDDPAVTLNAAAAFLSLALAYGDRKKKALGPGDRETIARFLARDLEAWRSQSGGGGDDDDAAPLVNPQQYTRRMADAKLMVEILVGILQQQQPQSPQPPQTQQQQQQRPEPVVPVVPAPAPELVSKKRKADDHDDDDDNVDGGSQPPSLKRQCSEEQVGCIRFERKIRIRRPARCPRRTIAQAGRLHCGADM